jgi:hypothetical protein
MWLKLHTVKCLELDRDDMDVTNIIMAERSNL